MIFLILIFALVCIWNIQLVPEGNSHYMQDYMSIDKTMAIKGIFILLVFFSHFNTYVDFTSAADLSYLAHYKMIGQRMVTLFMLYSGYGVMESIKKKKMGYIHKIPVTRVLGTLFRFDIAVLIFALINIIIHNGPTFSIKTFLLSLIGVKSIGNSNWYIFAILVCYIATFIGFEIFKDKGKYFLSAAATALILVAYTVIFHFGALAPSRFYNTILCYAVGVFFSLFKDKFDKLFSNNTLWAIAFAFSSVLTVYSYARKERFYMEEISMFSFALAAVLFTMHFSLNNKALRFCGKHLFGIFILQRIPMLVFKQLGLADFNIYVYFVVCLAVTLVLAYFFEKYVGKLWSLIVKPKKNKA